MIFEAIAAIKIANESLAVIREGIKNISSIGQLGSHLNNLSDAQEKIEKKAEQGDMEAFFALEEIKQQRRAIREMLQWNGRAGLYEDWIKFEANRKELRENARKREAARKARLKKQTIDICIGLAVGIGILSAVGFLGYVFYWLSKQG